MGYLNLTLSSSISLHIKALQVIASKKAVHMPELIDLTLDSDSDSEIRVTPDRLMDIDILAVWSVSCL